MDTLIVVDMQNDFITGVFGNSEAEKIVSPMVKFIEKFNGNIEITLDEHPDDKRVVPTIEEQLLQNHCVRNSWGHELHPDIQKVLSDKCAYRHTKRTFGCLEVGDILNDYDKVENIYICGLCTDICVLNNALILRNKFPFSNVIVLSDLCAGTTLENHQKALDIMKMNCIEVKTSKEV